MADGNTALGGPIITVAEMQKDGRSSIGNHRRIIMTQDNNNVINMIFAPKAFMRRRKRQRDQLII